MKSNMRACVYMLCEKCMENDTSCLIIILGHYVLEKMHEYIKPYVNVKRQGKYDECEMHVFDHMMYDIQ